MLKIRLIGNKNDILWFRKIMERHSKIQIGDRGFSDLLSVKGYPKGFYRVHVEVKKANTDMRRSSSF